MAWLNCTPEKREKSRRAEYTEGSPYLDLLLLSSYEQALVNYWVEAGQVTQTANGPVPITWAEIKAWVEQFHSEQYVEWVEPRRPLRLDGIPDERYRHKPTPLLVTQCTLTDWELQMIKTMSQEYVIELSNNSIDAPCPKEIDIEELTVEEKLDNSKAMGASLKAMFGVVRSSAKIPAVEAAPNNT